MRKHEFQAWLLFYQKEGCTLDTSVVTMQSDQSRLEWYGWGILHPLHPVVAFYLLLSLHLQTFLAAADHRHIPQEILFCLKPAVTTEQWCGAIFISKRIPMQRWHGDEMTMRRRWWSCWRYHYDDDDDILWWWQRFWSCVTRCRVTHCSHPNTKHCSLTFLLSQDKYYRKYTCKVAFRGEQNGLNPPTQIL